MPNEAYAGGLILRRIYFCTLLVNVPIVRVQLGKLFRSNNDDILCILFFSRLSDLHKQVTVLATLSNISPTGKRFIKEAERSPLYDEAVFEDRAKGAHAWLTSNGDGEKMVMAARAFLEGFEKNVLK